jgi:two-component system NarL family response regulator
MKPLTNAGTLRILLVDDHTIVRHGLRLMLARLPGIQAVAEADSCLAALQQMATHPADLVIMDAHLPEISGVETTRRLLARHPGIKVIMLSGDSSAPLILDALRAGALAYVIKENSPEEMTRAIQAVMAGQGYFSPEVAAALARYCREHLLAAAPTTPPLSERERQLLQLLVQGKRNKEMAVQLGVTAKSIEAYRSRLKAKLGYDSSAELISFAIREGLAAS